MCGTQTALALVVLYVGLVHTWDFAIGKGDLLEFYINSTKTDTVRFESQNLGALAYDEVHNMILYVDKQNENDAIYGFNMTSMNYKDLTERNGRNIHGIAFDPATEILFFTDTKERSINWISLKPGSKNNVYGNVLLKMDEGIPTDLAVDSCKGFIYWINTNLTRPTIERARFNGSDREVVINPSSTAFNTTYKLQPHSLAIDLRSQRIYWFDPETSTDYNAYSVNLNGNNKKKELGYTLGDEIGFHNPFNALAVSKDSICIIGWCPECAVWSLGLHSQKYRFKAFLRFHKEAPVSFVANFKVSDQIQGKEDCDALTSLVQNNSLSNDTFKIATQYVGQFCVHGIQVGGLLPCKCLPGYIGERCDVSVCENYCLHGSCSFNDGGLPKCRCEAGYGERCEVNLCHGFCQNNGACSLNEKSEPVCACNGSFAGVRCEVSACLNYCFKGNCSVNDEGLPNCRCEAGFSGARCEVNVCHGYCLNAGECYISEEDEPVCACVDNYDGLRCEATKNDNVNTLTSYSAERNLTLTDLLSNWRKPISKVTVILESS